MIRFAFAFVLSASSARAANLIVVKIASGGDLPVDVTVDLAAGVLRQGAFEVPLIDLFPGDPFNQLTQMGACDPKYGGASYDHAAHQLVVEETQCTASKLLISRNTIIARLARARAWAAESRGDLAAARHHLEAAVTADPSFERATLDLARVELRLGDRAGAAATLRPIVVRSPVAHYLEYSANPTLAPVLDEPPLSNLRTATQGRARVGGLVEPMVAYSTRHDLLAIVRETPLGDGDYDQDDRKRRDVEMVFADPHGKVVATMSLLPAVLETRWSYDDLRDSADAIAIRLDAANRALRDLGFDAVPDAEIAFFKEAKSGSNVATFPHAKLGLAERGGTVRLLDHDHILAEHVIFKCETRPSAFPCEYPPTFVWGAWLPAQHLAVVSWSTSGAEHSDRTSNLEIWQLPSR